MADLKLFEYQHKQVRTVTIDGQVFFVAKDVCGILEIVNHKDAVSKLSDRMKRTVGVTDPLGQEKPTLVISETGVYKIAFRSNKPEAERFTDWIAEDVLPQIRKTGVYVSRQRILPLTAHTDEEVQKAMSKSVNGYNYEKGGKEEAIHWNVVNTLATVQKLPSQLVAEAKRAGLKSKYRTSGKAVLRATQPEAACCMSLADNLHQQGHPDEKVFKVSLSAKPVFRAMIELGIEPAELKE
jgi:prophage antirepressor-like protein